MKRRDAIREKIHAKTILEDGPMNTPCRIWQGGTSGSGRGGGYGRVSIDGGTMATHIAIFIVNNGPIPPKKQIDHLCRNRLCCADDHLEMVTHKQNQKRKLK